MKKEKMCSKKFAKGFTLIELLVVVVIIGILAAIALPQYRKAVLQAEFQEYIVWIKKIYDAQKDYRLTNNSYTRNFRALSLDFPQGSSFVSNAVTFPDGKRFYYLTDETTRFDFRNTHFLHSYNNGGLSCYHYGDKDKKALCQKLSTITCPAIGGGCFIRKIL